MQKIIMEVKITFKEREMRHMIKQIAWNTFKNTGNIDTFLELMEVENIEKNIKVNKYGDNKDKRTNFSRE